MNKPNRQYFVGPTEKEIRDFVNPLATRKICGIGRVMEKTLRGACGVETIKDLFDKRAEVYLLFKPASAKFLLRASIGYSDSKHRQDSTAEDESDDAEEALNRKGISHERTFSPTSIWSEMCTKLEGITLALVQDLRRLRPKTITLKIKLANFHILSRSTTREIALFENCNQRQSSIDLVDIVINLLKEAKHEYENGKLGQHPLPKQRSFQYVCWVCDVQISSLVRITNHHWINIDWLEVWIVKQRNPLS